MSSEFYVLDRKLDHLLWMMRQVLLKEKEMSAELQALIDQVTANTSVETSAVTAINGLAAQIAALAANGGTPAQFQALADQLKASAISLGAAVVANTPPAPAVKKH